MWLGILLIVGGFGVVLVAAKSKNSSSYRTAARTSGVALVPHRMLADASEQRAYALLEGAHMGQSHVLAKVRLADFLDALGPDAGPAHDLEDAMRRTRVDFLLVDERFTPLLAVDIGRHPGLEDALPAQALLSRAGVPLLRLEPGGDWRTAIADAAASLR